MERRTVRAALINVSNASGAQSRKSKRLIRSQLGQVASRIAKLGAAKSKHPKARMATGPADGLLAPASILRLAGEVTRKQSRLSSARSVVVGYIGLENQRVRVTVKENVRTEAYRYESKVAARLLYRRGRNSCDGK